ncbi:MAG: hypothetical protein RSA91_04605 [Bacilli bacterium]
MKKLTIFKSCIEKLKNYKLEKDTEKKTLLTETILRNWSKEELLDQNYSHNIATVNNFFNTVESCQSTFLEASIAPQLPEEALKEILLNSNKSLFQEEEFEEMQATIQKQRLIKRNTQK